MPTTWTITITAAATWAGKAGLGPTWFGDWRHLQAYTWVDLQAFTWTQLASTDDYTKTTASAASWTVTT